MAIPAHGHALPAGFVLPDLYDFPPFFTLQPVDATRARQLEAWVSLLVRWAAATHTPRLAPVRSWPLWEHAGLGRRLPEEGQRAVIEAAVAAGSASWEAPDRSEAAIWWRSPAEWGRVLHNAASSRGAAAAGQIFTIYELRTAPEWVGGIGGIAAADWTVLDAPLILRALEAAEREGLVALVREASPPVTGGASAAGDAAAAAAAAADDVGVKFIER